MARLINFQEAKKDIMTEAEIKLETAMRAHSTELFKLIAAILALITGVFVMGATIMYWYLKFTGGLS